MWCLNGGDSETRFTWVMKNSINLLKFIGDIWEDGMEQNGVKDWNTDQQPSYKYYQLIKI